MPGVGDIIRVMSSDCKLWEESVNGRLGWKSSRPSLMESGAATYRFVTLWVSALRVDVLSLLTSAIVGASGA